MAAIVFAYDAGKFYRQDCENVNFSSSDMHQFTEEEEGIITEFINVIK